MLGLQLHLPPSSLHEPVLMTAGRCFWAGGGGGRWLSSASPGDCPPSPGEVVDLRFHSAKVERGVRPSFHGRH